MTLGKRMVLKFKMWLGYDPAEDDKLPPDLLRTDPAEHFRTWDRGLRRWWGG